MNTPAAPIPKKSRLRYLLWLPLLLILSLLGILFWLYTTTSGLRFVLNTAEQFSQGMLHVEGVQGQLNQTIQIDKLKFTRPDLQVSAQAVRLDWQPHTLLQQPLQIQLLKFAQLDIWAAPSAEKKPPQQIVLPLAVVLHKVEIAALRLASKQPEHYDTEIHHITGSLHSDGKRHEIKSLAASTEYGAVRLSGWLEGLSPFKLNSQVELEGLSQYTHGDNAKIQAKLSGDLLRILLNADGSGAGLSGHADLEITPFAAFPIAQLSVHTQQFNPQSFSPKLPQAQLTLDSDLRSQPDGKFTGTFSLHNHRPDTWDKQGLPIQQANADVAVTRDWLQLKQLSISFGEQSGRLTGELEAFINKRYGTADLAIQQLNLAKLDSRLRPMQLSGHAKLKGDEQQQQAELELNDGNIHLATALEHKNQQITLTNLQLSHQQSSLLGQGTFQLASPRAFQFTGQLQQFDIATWAKAPHSNLNATLDLSGELQPVLHGQVQFAVRNSQFDQHAIEGDGKVFLDAPKQGRGEVELRLGDNRVNGTGQIGYGHDQAELKINAPQLAQISMGLVGDLQAQLSISQAQSTVSLQSQSLQFAKLHKLQNVSGQGKLQGEQLEFQLSAASYQQQSEMFAKELRIQANGTRAQHQISAQAQLQDKDQLQLALQGSVDTVHKVWQGSLQQLSGMIKLPFSLQNKPALKISSDLIELGDTQLKVAGANLQLSRTHWTPQRWVSEGKFSELGMQLASQMVEIDRRNTLKFTGGWALDSAEYLNGSLHIERDQGDILIPIQPALPLGLSKLQLQTNIQQSKFSSELQAQGTHLGEVYAQISSKLSKKGNGWTLPRQTPVTGLVKLDITDLAWLAPLVNDDITSSGQLHLESNIGGDYGNVTLKGKVQGENLAINLVEHGIQLNHGALQAEFDHQALNLQTLSFNAPISAPPKDPLLSKFKLENPSGTLVASGSMNWHNNSGDLTLTAIQMPLSQHPERWVLASGNAQANMQNKVLQIKGNVQADAGLIKHYESGRPKLSDDIVLPYKERKTRDTRLQLNLGVDLGQHFYLSAAGLETRLKGQITMHDNGKKLHTTGSIATEDAKFKAYGQNLTVERGIVNFQGGLHDPGLNILALRKQLPVEAGVEVTGTVMQPLIRLVSTPNVPDPEKLSWIVLGRAPDSSGMDSTLLLAAANSILGDSAGGITGTLKQTLGIDEFGLRQADTSKLQDKNKDKNNRLSNQIISIGKRLSSRAFISYEQSVTASAGITKLTYQLTPRVNIVTQAGMDNAVDVFYTFRFE